MGFKRFMKKNLIPFYNTRDMIDKVQTYGFVDGIKEKMREDFLEDTPISSHIYNAGKHEGKKDGYKKASIEYEKKLLAQANAFLNQKEIFESQKQEYEQLLQEYENYIEEMNAKEHLTNEEQDNLLQIISMERKLTKLVV
ncbi:hypothetical protein [Bacillus cereus]|uniref:hypothetical protein n=1 Tax=Bacillus cereus TaxID=1396 RepID=UPI000BF9A564|nr:hypothetical protein [Bacillus cereus]PFM38952.1 hypothetical protein COJ47_00065 [Bacillus cereus]